MKKINAGNLFAGMRSSSVIAGLFIVLIVSIVLLFANFAYLNTQSNHDKQYIGHAGELRVLSQRIAKNATEAAAGKGEAFKLLKDARNDFEKRWNILVNGDESTSLPPSPEAVKPQMDVVQQDWDGLRKNADSILASEQTVLSLHQVASTLAETIPQLQVEYEEVVDILLENGAPADQVAVAQRQSLLAERILGSVNKVLAGDENSVQAADSFGRDASLFGRVLKGMQEGNAAMSISKVTNAEAVDRLNEIAELFEFVSGSVDEILETSPDLFQVREAANNIFSVSQTLLDKASQLADGFENLAGGRSINLFAGYVLGALALASIILIGLVMVRETNRRLAETAEKNDRNQAAILRLLDEIADLADGDLTVAATVTEDFTGAIADSINYSIDQLRELVETINQTAVQVAAAAQETQSTAMHLAEASEHQAQEIAGASAAINEMAVSIDQVSANASESSAVAERSVAIANKGNEVVHNTITGMDNIREQIQDTSKRIKRLGESSQEIEALVKTIQTDTNEAVISMEQTTSEVVRGARLAQDAGVALEEIEKVSKTLAALIQNISNAARQQASSAGHISNTMNVIQEITSQTSAGTTATARSIGNLAKMASEMRNSVSGFKLPEGVEQA
ncbi:methyl-accepting chemotaxis protein [Pseudomonas aeruginosa]|uniref:methyl-accepting chemotaxis protein n=1 Tax=Pseudomonas aeruginosa TaxID=287 RepID=UPI0026ED1201|nr:type IV pili methyl-accepting chemotaxis transducer N-terminal domain-containing protein [Pseudomonas aeruginosa]